LKSEKVSLAACDVHQVTSCASCLAGRGSQACRLRIVPQCVQQAPLYGVHKHAVVPRARVLTHRWLLLVPHGSLERWLRLFRSDEVS